MEKTISDKQLIRSLADMMIENPISAIMIFKDMKDVLLIFPELESVVEFITSYDYEECNYIERFSKSIDKITHIQTKAIFKSSLEYHKKTKKHLQ